MIDDGAMRLEVALDFADNPRPNGALCAPADTMPELYEALMVLATAYRAAVAAQVVAESARIDQPPCATCWGYLVDACRHKGEDSGLRRNEHE